MVTLAARGKMGSWGIIVLAVAAVAAPKSEHGINSRPRRLHKNLLRFRGGSSRSSMRRLDSIRREERRRMDMLLDEDNPYAILGVPEGTSGTSLKSRFFELSRALHPDKDIGDPHAKVRYQKIFEAYSKLSAMAEENRETSTHIMKPRLEHMSLASDLMTSEYDSLFATTAFRPLVGESTLGQFMQHRNCGLFFQNLFAPPKLFADRVSTLARNMLEMTKKATSPLATERTGIESATRQNAERLASLPLGPEILGVIGRAYKTAASVYLVEDWRAALWKRIQVGCSVAGKFCKLALTIMSSGTDTDATFNAKSVRRKRSAEENEKRGRQIDLAIAWRLYEWDTTSCLIRAVNEALQSVPPLERVHRAKVIDALGKFYTLVESSVRERDTGSTPAEIMGTMCELQ